MASSAPRICLDTRTNLWYNTRMSKGNTNTDSRKKETEELMELHIKKEQQTPRVLSTVDRIHELEQLARKGDLIAFHEWKKLTNNDIVRVEVVSSIPINAYAKCDLRSVNPDIRFESQSFGVGFGF